MVMLQGSGGQRFVAQAQVVFGAGQGLGRGEDLPLHAVAVLDLLRGLPVAPPGPGCTESRGVRGQQRRADQRPDPGAEAVEQQVGQGNPRMQIACSRWRRGKRIRARTPARVHQVSASQAPRTSPALRRRTAVEPETAPIPML